MSVFGPATSAERVLAALLDVSDEAVVTTDVEGVVTSWSDGAARLYGFDAAEMVGAPIDRVVPEGERPLLAAGYERVRHGHRLDTFETTRLAKDGRLLHVSSTLSPIRDDGHAVVGVLSVTRDIRTQKRSEAALQASQERWRALLDSAVDAIVVIDARGRIEAFNPAAERLFGYSERDVTGRNVSMLMPSPYKEEHDSYLARYLREGDARIIGKGRDVTARRRDGSTFPVHLAVGAMEMEGERKFTGILHDLSDRARMEALLREQAALVRLGEMAAVIAHEVKNPLAGIRGAIQVIGGRLPAGSTEAAVTHDIVARIDALDEMMKDMLLFARPPQPRIAAVDVRALIATTSELLTRDPALKDVTVEIGGGAPTVQADAGLLKIVFLNLLVNGAHAMHGRGALTVTIAQRGPVCAIEFADAGPGISADVREKIFTPFFTTKSRGTGLGLPTAKRLIDAHGGSISIDCPSGGGTIVRVELPMQP